MTIVPGHRSLAAGLLVDRRSTKVRDHWASQAKDLAADVRAELGNRAELTVRLWPLQDNDQGV